MTDLWATILMALSFFASAEAFIVPDELPSLLSTVYSNIPTIKAGTDSRLGFGFRLGNRADFQVLIELGPQEETQPLGNQNANSDGYSKRQTLDSLSNVLYAQRLREKQNIERKKTGTGQKLESEQPATVSVTAGGKWLENWSKSVRRRHQQKLDERQLSFEPRPGTKIGGNDAKSVILPDDRTKMKSSWRSSLMRKLSSYQLSRKQREQKERRDVVSSPLRQPHHR